MIINGIERDYIVHDDKNIKGFFGEYRYLSNFEVCPVYFEGMLFPSSEAAYMAAKTEDLEIRKQFQTLKPSDAKKLGRTIKLREGWDDMKYDVMSSVVFDKFYRNIELRKKLLETGNKYIEETNHWKDVVWGVCDGEGKSWLGNILMSVREFWKDKPIEKEPIKLF